MGNKGCGRLVPMSCKICPACGRVFITEKHEYQLYLEEVKAKLENINECDLTVGRMGFKDESLMVGILTVFLYRYV